MFMIIISLFSLCLTSLFQNQYLYLSCKLVLTNILISFIYGRNVSINIFFFFAYKEKLYKYSINDSHSLHLYKFKASHKS